VVVQAVLVLAVPVVLVLVQVPAFLVFPVQVLVLVPVPVLAPESLLVVILGIGSGVEEIFRTGFPDFRGLLVVQVRVPVLVPVLVLALVQVQVQVRVVVHVNLPGIVGRAVLLRLTRVLSPVSLLCLQPKRRRER
jgi:hypothetical protein